MTFHSGFTRRISVGLLSLVLGLASLLGGLLLPAAPALADLITRDTPGYQQLSQEISDLQQELAKPIVRGQDPSASQNQRLADLLRLEAAIADSNDRATVSNDTSHSLGIYARYKKQPVDQPASFYVLAPGHSSDDDYEAVALYLPAGVALAWEGKGAVVAGNSPRVVKLLPGEELQVSEQVSEQSSADGLDGPANDQVTYQLSLPAFAIESQTSDLVARPVFSQQELDAQPESAPLD